MSSTLPMRVSEVYASTQGEGPNVGRVTVFLRFGGCNLRCPGWPCDTQHAIDPAFRKDWLKHTVDELVERVDKVAEAVDSQWITFTGGEPFLQPKRPLMELVKELSKRYNLEAFSNGTIEYPEWAVENISFIMDWKLPGSGEDPMNAMRLYNLKMIAGGMEEYSRTFDGPAANQAVKFVIKDERDLQAAHGLWFQHIHKAGLSDLEVFYGKVWDGDLEDKDLVAYVLSNGLPWRLNRQEHNYIWPANERGR